METHDSATRRTILAAGAGVAGTVALAGCGGGSGSEPGKGSTGTGQNQPSQSASAGGTSTGTALAKLADIPVGSAVPAKGPDGKPVVVARPTEQTAACFSAICTHMGCTVAPSGKQLKCPCHGSVFEAGTGKVVSGPAPRPLPAVQVHVVNGEVLPGSA